MRDFPPTTTAFLPVPDAEVPDTRSPGAFLRWHLRSQRSVIVASTLLRHPVAAAADRRPVAGRQGGRQRHRRPRTGTPTLAWSGLLLLVTLIGAVFGIAMHTLIVAVVADRALRHHPDGRPQGGPARPRAAASRTRPARCSAWRPATPTSSARSPRSPRGPTAQLVAYLIVAAIVLKTSLTLGVLVLLAAPVLVGVALPLLRPLHRRQAVERSRSSDLTSMATDIVAGLRILRGIGGERTFGRNYAAQSQRTRRAGVSAGIWQAAIEAIGVLFSGLLPGRADVGRDAARCSPATSRVGQLISFLGYGLFMVGPIRTFFEFAQKLTRALVSARKAIAIFEQAPPWREPPTRCRCPHDGRPRRRGDRLRGHARAAHRSWSAPSPSRRPRSPTGWVATCPPTRSPRASAPTTQLKGRAARRSRAERQAERERIAALRRGARPPALGRPAGRRRPRRGRAGRRTPPDPGQRHRQPALRRHPPGRHRPARRADPRAAEEIDPDRQRRGRVRRAARRLAGRARRARPRPLRRPAAAGRPGPRARRRRADPGAGRAHLGRRRAHRGADRRAGRRAPARPHHRGGHGVAALAAPRRPRSCCCDDGRVVAVGAHEEPAGGQRRLPPAWSPARWTTPDAEWEPSSHA